MKQILYTFFIFVQQIKYIKIMSSNNLTCFFSFFLSFYGWILIFFLRTWAHFRCRWLLQTSLGWLFGHHLMRFPTKTQQTSAGMRLFTDLDQQGLFSHFGCTWDGSEWQLHEIKSLIAESRHHTSKCASRICLCIYFLFVFQKADSFPVTTCSFFSQLV